MYISCGLSAILGVIWALKINFALFNTVMYPQIKCTSHFTSNPEFVFLILSVGNKNAFFHTCWCTLLLVTFVAIFVLFTLFY